MKMDRILSMLGLAEKAGKIASGEFSTEKAVKSRQACMVIVAEDASLNTRKMFQNMCSYYQVPLYFYADKERLGHSIGKQYRASLAVVDEGFSKSLESKLKMLEKTE
ncbi:MAG: 50S ribosomal protein L7ae [Lachnospiraceae bacterium]|nr:50S ribosomal protein L7ae [Lachnospiraceae bacterium]